MTTMGVYSGEILALIEVDDETGKIDPSSLELLEIGRRISRETSNPLSAVIIGFGVQGHSAEIAKYASKVYVVDDPALKEFSPELYTYVLEKICRQVDPAYVLLSHTYKGMDIAPRLAAKLRTPLTTNCIGLEINKETGLFERKKLVFGGNVIATFIYEGKPQLVTIRPKTFEKIKETLSSPGKIVHLDIDVNTALSKVKIVRRIREESVKLDDADAIIAGGRGIDGPEGFKELEKIKDALSRIFKKVEIGASRPPVDKGWVSPSRQIGITGEKVSPILYIGIGISGATQHIVGMESSKIIVAINNNPKAPIFSVSDIGVIADYKEILPFLIKRLEESLCES